MSDDFEGTEEAWLQCPGWSGEERDLPAGEQMRVPEMSSLDFVKRWKILCPEEDEGYRLIRRAELTKKDRIIGVVINENSVNVVVATYGKRFFVAARADAPLTLYDRWEWREKYGTDVLVLEALKTVRREISGGGIRIG